MTAEQVRRGAAMHEEWKRRDRSGTGCLMATVGLLTIPISLAAGLIDTIA
ncbi:hypothetical protein ACFO4E_15705 [Nocardiopsis mangrovi]|uniref:Uncharacterized protein n=1 Tax=Nocardiopsis mangrovi TaxID=1179818 RepID=A0ABV9E145_9ACTN